MATEDLEEPFGWWGWHWQPPQPLSVVQLLEAHSFDAELLGLVWALMARRASVIVGAEPPMAGKTTTLTALLDFLPQDSKRVYMRGHYENFDFTTHDDINPQQTYLLANEMSDHLAVYFWGARIGRLFSLLPQGYAFGSTMHAETAEEVLDILAAWPLSIPPTLLGGLNLVINLVLLPGGGRSTRRCCAVTLILPGDGPLGVKTIPLSKWDREADQQQHFHEQPEVAAALANWAGTSPELFLADVKRRAAYLEQLQQDRVRTILTVQQRLAEFAS